MNEDRFVEVKDDDWASSGSTKEERKRIANENWEKGKADWQELKEERYENTLEGKWVQRGPYLINRSAKIEYGVYIGLGKRLTGIDENGKPVLEDTH